MQPIVSLLRKLRPAKIRSALRRRWFEWRLGRLELVPVPTVSLGSDYGGWELPDAAVAAGQICYCIGTGDDVSFDLDLVRRYGAIVRAVDPVEAYEPVVRAAAAGESRFTYRRAALATRDGPIMMQAHHEPRSASLSAAALYETDQWVEVEGRTLQSLMREFGDEVVDLLKVDVEGLEYELVPMLDLVALGVRVFAIQLHHTGSVRQALDLIDGLTRQGFQLVARRPVLKLAFARDYSASSTASASTEQKRS